MATAPVTTSPDSGPQGSPHVSGSWLTRGRDGRLSLFLPGEQEVVRWTEHGSGWQGPDRLPAPGVLPRVTVAQGEDGYVHLVGGRRTATGDLELVHAVQFQTGRPMLGWSSLGHPNRIAKWTGDPAAVVDGAGRLCVALKNGGGGVSVRLQQTNGGWGRWQDLGGRRVRETLAAAVDGDGLVELFVADATSVARWTQEKPGAAFTAAERLTVKTTPAVFSAMTTQSGEVVLFFSDEDGTVRRWAPGHEEDARLLLEAAGPGPLVPATATIDGHPCTVLAQETADGEVAFAAYPTGNEDAGAWWTPTAPGAGSGLSLALRPHGEQGLVAAVLPPGGQPLLNRQKTAEGGFALGRWKPLH
ncbi:hypothetical protein [Streptomyces sp. t39]|uniref:hypothetical protein n=1 Tax=Streptomyces sp. t39 TaxID=1828156 RepID=UPI0011CD9339|nr:hypothetical protein [Streptomyces sp. t39]TXS57370.1 hypothetical protein EAO77_15825 [Streptomyces sp. t39]